MTSSRRVRLKALLALGVLAIAFASGTFAAWTDSATIGGGTFTSGTLDLQVNNGDSHVTTTLGMTAMVPGSTATEVIVVKNAGTAPLKYSLQGGLTGTDATAYNTAGSLKITVVLNGTRAGSGNSATCTGGTVLVAADLPDCHHDGCHPRCPGAARRGCHGVGLPPGDTGRQRAQHAAGQDRGPDADRRRHLGRELMRATRGVVDRTLTLLAGFGVACVLVTLAGPAFGLHALFFRSGSMQPTIGTGAMALAVQVPVSEVRTGDVVSVTTPQGSRVTHRVVSRTGDALVLKGDANAVPDATPYRTETVDRVVTHVPMLGYVVGWLTGPLGLVLLGVLGLGLLALVVRPELLAGVAVVTIVTVAVLGPGQVRPGWAAPWTDPATVSGSSYTAGVVGAPVVTCTTGLATVRFNWAAVPGATGYRVHYGSGGGTLDVGSAVTSYAITLLGSGTFWVEALRAFPSVAWESVASNKKNYSVATVLLTCSDA